jgi:hypothetical protein
MLEATLDHSQDCSLWWESRKSPAIAGGVLRLTATHFVLAVPTRVVSLII